jgi:WD40 repeat protein
MYGCVEIISSVLLIPKTNRGSVRELKSTTTLLPKSTTDYQKTAQFSPNGKWLVTGSDEGQLTLLSYPDLKIPFPEQGKEMKGGILDVDFDRKDERFVTVRENELTLWGMREGKQLESLDSPILHQKTQCTFRSAR